MEKHTFFLGQKWGWTPQFPHTYQGYHYKFIAMLAAAAPQVDDDELQMRQYQRDYFDFLDDGKDQQIYINKVFNLK